MRPTRGSRTSASPASSPRPATTFTTPGGKAGFVEQLTESQQRARRLLRRLQHDGVARGERGAELGDGDRERRVPRDDETDDSDRLADREVEAGRPDLHRVAADLVGGTGEVEEHLGARGQVEERRLHDDAAVVACLDLGQLVGVGAHHLGQPAEMACTRERRKCSPALVVRGARRRPPRRRRRWRRCAAPWPTPSPVDGSMLSSTAPDRAGRRLTVDEVLERDHGATMARRARAVLGRKNWLSFTSKVDP